MTTDWTHRGENGKLHKYNRRYWQYIGDTMIKLMVKSADNAAIYANKPVVPRPKE